ncbi:MAG TPA: hypothetical protein VK670_08430, partial [Silvibacterium sp.]|nr:hypothetical protein [Silvibacterium sp.]
MQRQGGASVSSQVDAKFAEAMFIKTELIAEDSGQRFPGQSGGLRVGVVGGIGVDRYTELVAKQLEDIQTEVLPAVVVHEEAPRQRQFTAIRRENGSAGARNQQHVAELHLVRMRSRPALEDDF